MFVNAVVFQALAASIAISGASAHSHRRARRGDIVNVEEKRQFPDPFTAIAYPVGTLVSSLIPDGITQNPAFNTQVSSIAAQVSSAIPTISPVVSIVTFVFPVSQTSSSAPIATMAPPPPPPSSEAPPAPSSETPPPPPPSSSFATSTKGACATATETVTRTQTVTETATATVTATSTAEATPQATVSSAPASSSAEATCGPYALPCALEPIASVVKSVVPPQTMAPQLNSAVSMVAAAVSSANPQLSTPKEITDKILPFPVPGRA